MLGEASGVAAFTVYVALKADAPIDDSTVEMVARQLRPEDEEMCVWRDEYDPCILRASTDVQAADFEAAIDTGRVIAQEALGFSGIPAQINDVVAITDEGRPEWRPA